MGCDFGLNAPTEDSNGIYLNLLSNTELSTNGILRIYKNKAYIIGNYYEIWDISDKARPEPSITYLSVMNYEIKDAIITDSYSYIISRDTLFIIEVNSNFFSIIGKIGFNATATNIKINENYAYVKTSNGNLLTINISSPSNPVLLGTVTLEYPIVDYIIENKVGYILSNYYLQTYDFSNPTQPVPIGISKISMYSGTGLKKSDEYLYCRVVGIQPAIYVIKIKGQTLEPIRYIKFPNEILDFDFDKYGIATDGSTVYLLNAQTPYYLCVTEKLLGGGAYLKTEGDYIYYLQNQSLLILKVEKLR